MATDQVGSNRPDLANGSLTRSLRTRLAEASEWLESMPRPDLPLSGRGLAEAGSEIRPEPSVHPVVGSELADELRKHSADAFPESVVKGEVYGEVDAVMIDADICGWAMGADVLSSPDRTLLRQAADALERSILALPAEAQPYFQRLLHIARLALTTA